MKIPVLVKNHFEAEKKILARLVVRRDHEDGWENIRPVLLILGGSMRGPYGAGAVSALYQAGFGRVFQTVVGVSTGAATTAYFLGGEKQIALGASLYYEECTRKEFMNPLRRRRKVDIDRLIGWMSHGPKALDVVAIQNHPTQFYVSAITRHGRQELINAKTAQPDLLTAIKSSMALPGLYGEWVTVNSRQYCDGGFNQPIPITTIIKKFDPTDIVILPNQTETIALNFQPNIGDAVAGLLTLRQLGFRKSWEVYNRKRLYRNTLHSQVLGHSNIAILWPPDGGLHEGTTDPIKLKSAFEASRQSTQGWLEKRWSTKII